MSRRKRRRKRPEHAAEVGGPSLDLHGLTAGEARREAERWLRTQAAAGESRVTVVTGRGIHSGGKAVLPTEVGHLLGVLQGEGVVEDFIPVSLGGAFRVFLRAECPRTSKRPAGAFPVMDETLRRQAEESLLELGIQPTPETIAAEARRMAREGRGADGNAPD